MSTNAGRHSEMRSICFIGEILAVRVVIFSSSLYAVSSGKPAQMLDFRTCSSIKLQTQNNKSLIFSTE